MKVRILFYRIRLGDGNQNRTGTDIILVRLHRFTGLNAGSGVGSVTVFIIIGNTLTEFLISGERESTVPGIVGNTLSSFTFYTRISAVTVFGIEFSGGFSCDCSVTVAVGKME